jgi:carbonic anhydrase
MARFLSILPLLAGALAHEHHGTSLFPRDAALAPPTFGYHGLTGPLNWFNLNQTANAMCAKGTHQSPIDLSQSFLLADASSNPQISLSAAPQGAEFINLGTTVEVMGANGTLVMKGKTSKLAQFHFHSPSEHSINGVYYPLEMHFVFQADDASLSVVGFVIDIGGSSFEPLGTLAASLDEIPQHGNETITKPLDFARLERHFRKYGTYQ